MNYQDLVEQITPELYTTFKRALEVGKWPDGSEMTQEQRTHCLDAVIAYDQLHLAEEERVGYIDKGRKAKTQPSGEAEQLLRFADDRVGTGKDGGTE